MIDGMTQGPRQRLAPIPSPIPDRTVTESDLAYLAADFDAGYQLSADLYRNYCCMVESEGRVPASKVMLGAAMKRAGWTSSLRYVDKTMKRCWLVTRPWIRRGMAQHAEGIAAAKEAASRDVG